MTDWQPVKGDSKYEVSAAGDIRVRDTQRVLGQWLNDQGYMLARLREPRRMVRVHRVVAEAFIPNPYGRPFVNHIDNNRANNRASNLEWCTQFENLAHARAQGRMPDNHWAGKRSPSAVLSDGQVTRIRELHRSGDWSYHSLAKLMGVSKRAVGRIIHRETYADV